MPGRVKQCRVKDKYYSGKISKKSFFSFLFASFSMRSFKYSNYNIGKALPYLNPSGPLATWPNAFSYTGGAVRACLSPSSRFSLERCTFHPSPAGASHRASRNTPFKRCNFCEWRTQTPHSEGAITKGEWRIARFWILECKEGRKNIASSKGPSCIVAYNEEAEPKSPNKRGALRITAAC